METKSELRRRLKAARLQLTEVAVAEKSALMVAGVQTVLENVNFKGLHCYEPIASLKEVDTSLLEAEATYTTRNLDGEWKVISFKTGLLVEHPEIDVIIVPMLGFDDKLHRIGYGGGYYDRLLASHPHALKIGVCYEAGHVEKVPSEGHDVALDMIITETRVVIAV